MTIIAPVASGRLAGFLLWLTIAAIVIYVIISPYSIAIAIAMTVVSIGNGIGISIALNEIK